MSVNRTGPASTSDLQLVVCVVGDERYGLEVGRVREIIRLPEITALPGSHPSVSGVINLRGRIIPIMDLRQRFGLAAAAPTRLSRIVVAEADELQIGLVVDAVEEVVHIAANAIEPPPALTTAAGSDHLIGIAKSGDQLIILIDLDPLIGTGALALSAGPDAGAGGRAPA